MQDILSQFPLPSVNEVRPTGSGLMNATYKVTTDGGIFALQKLHDVIPDAAAEDMRVVTSFLAEKGLSVPSLVLTKTGAPFYRAADGARWRVYPWIEGRVVDAVADEAMAREAGMLVGRMHKYLAELDYRPQGSIPHFHDTAYILGELRGVLAQLPDEVRAAGEDIAATLPELIITNQSSQIIHADLKISNLLFDNAGKAVGVIDFDTLLWHSRAVDLGDAYRSWCNRTSEDDGKASFDLALFSAAEQGYAEGWGHALTPEDVTLHLRATRQIALELASRFLIDVVRDNYFGFDPQRYPTRRAANIARALGQYHLASTIPLNL